LDDINDLGDEISDLMQDPENYLKAFALLKNSKFAVLMESTESVHRSFAESMKDNGKEKLMFGMCLISLVKNSVNQMSYLAYLSIATLQTARLLKDFYFNRWM
jgi:hypothetical protein